MTVSLKKKVSLYKRGGKHRLAIDSQPAMREQVRIGMAPDTLMFWSPGYGTWVELPYTVPAVQVNDHRVA